MIKIKNKKIFCIVAILCAVFTILSIPSQAEDENVLGPIEWEETDLSDGIPSNWGFNGEIKDNVLIFGKDPGASDNGRLYMPVKEIKNGNFYLEYDYTLNADTDGKGITHQIEGVTDQGVTVVFFVLRFEQGNSSRQLRIREFVDGTSQYVYVPNSEGYLVKGETHTMTYKFNIPQQTIEIEIDGNVVLTERQFPSTQQKIAKITQAKWICTEIPTKMEISNIKIGTQVNYRDVVQSELGVIDIENKDAVTNDFRLETQAITDAEIRWESDNPAIRIENNSMAIVTRPEAEEGDVVVNLTVTVTYFTYSESKTIQVTVKRKPTLTEQLELVSESLNIESLLGKNKNADNIVTDLILPLSLENGVEVCWESSSPCITPKEGKGLVNASLVADEVVKEQVTLTAILSKQGVSIQKEFQVYVLNSSYYNLAKGGKTWASSELSTNLSNQAVDDNNSTPWIAHENAQEAYLIVDLGKTCSVNTIELIEKNNVMKTFRLEYSQNKSNWITITTGGSIGDGNLKVITFPSVMVRYLRYYVTTKDFGETGLYEIRVFKRYDDNVRVSEDLAEIELPKRISGDLELPVSGTFGTHYTWKSSDTSVIDDLGNVTRSSRDKSITLTVVGTLNDASAERQFPITVIGSGSSGGSGGTGGSNRAGGGSYVGKQRNDSALITPPVISSAPTSSPILFEDIDENYWAKTYIESLVKRKLLDGVSKTKFEPERAITRAEFVKVLITSLGFELQSAKISFKDISDKDWYAPYIQTAIAIGIVRGISEDYFGTQEPICRQDMAVMVSNALRVKGISLIQKDVKIDFIDKSELADYAVESVASLVANDIMSGMPDGSFIPNGATTRAQAAKVIFVLLGKIQQTGGDKMERWFSILFTGMFIVSLLAFMPRTFGANPADIPQKERNLTDEEFLGIWDEDVQDWKVQPRIRYDYSPKLLDIEKNVKMGDYDMAREELFKYYKQTGRKYLRPNEGRRSASQQSVNLMCENIWLRGSIQSTSVIKNKLDWYSFDVTSIMRNKIREGISTAAYVFMGREKGDDLAIFYSREAGTETTAYLEIVVNGEPKRFQAIADTYIRAGKYAGKAYGTEERLYVRESGMPVDDNNMRTYLWFDFSGIPRTATVTSASIKLYGCTDGIEEMPMMMLNCERQTNDEETRTWESSGVYFFSWKGRERLGLGKWTAPAFSGYDYMAPLYRFWNAMGILGTYERTGDEYYAEKVIEYTLDFYDNYGGGGLLVPKEERGGDTNLAAGLRMQMLVDIYLSLLRSPSLDAKEHLQFVKLIYDDTDFLAHPDCFWGHHASGNNWGSSGNVAIALATAFFPEFDKQEEWLEEAAKRVEYQLTNLIMDDGAYVEATNSYPISVFNDFTHYKALMTMIDYHVPSSLDFKLKRFLYAFMNCIDPSLCLTEYGDDGYEFSQSFLDTIYEMGQSYNDPYLLYIGSNRKEGSPPKHLSISYPNGGYTIMRDGWNKNNIFAFLITRPYGTHSHNHSMHITLNAYGRRLLADTSQYSYNDEPISNWQRYRRVSHNVIEVDDKTKYLGWTKNLNLLDADSETISSPSYDIFDGHFKEMETPLGKEYYDMKRRVLFLKPLRYFIVSDYVEVQYDNVREHKFNQVWHMDKGANPQLDPTTKKFYSKYESGANIMIVPADPETIEASIKKDGYLGTTPHNYGSYVKRSESDVTFDTVLYPTGNMSEEDVRVDRIALDVDTTTASAIRVNVLSGRSPMYSGLYYTSYEEVPSQRNFDTAITDGKMAFINKDANEDITYAVLSGGTFLTDRSIKLISSQVMLSDLSVEWNMGKLEISSSVKDSALLGRVTIYAPDRNSLVTYNGKAVFYGRKGDYITLNPSVVIEEQTFTFNDFEVNIPVNIGELETKFTVSSNGGTVEMDGLIPKTLETEILQTNIAKGKDVSVNNVQDSSMNAMTDGNLMTSFISNDMDYPKQINIDLGEISEIDNIEVIWGNHSTNLGRYLYEIYASTDGNRYSKLIEGEAVDKSCDYLFQRARYIRINVLSNSFYVPLTVKEILVNTNGGIESGTRWNKILKVGEEGMALSSPIRIIFEKMASSEVGTISPNGEISLIENTISCDSPNAFVGADFAKFICGDNLIVWTRKGGNFMVFGNETISGDTEENKNEGGGRPNDTDHSDSENRQDDTDKADSEESKGGKGNISNNNGIGGRDNTGNNNSTGGKDNIGSVTIPKPELPYSSNFSDVENHWAKKDILDMVDLGVVKGVSETSFEPDRGITRAEFTAMTVRALNLEQDEYKGIFSDVSNNAWYANDLQTAYNAQLISGSNGVFRPNDFITREEAIKIIVASIEMQRSIEIEPEEIDFSDKEDISQWSLSYVLKAVSLGLVKGDDKNCINPQMNTTRAEAVVMLKRMLTK